MTSWDLSQLTTLVGLLGGNLNALLDQHARMLQVSTALPQLALVPERVVCKEGLSQPFELTVDCLSLSAYFELKALIGEQISVRLLQSDGQYKSWHGYVAQAMQLGADGGLARYRLVMSPWLHFLGIQRDARVFQDQDAQQIIEAVFKPYTAANFRFELAEPLPSQQNKRSLCTQYRESDLEFIARLLAQEGLSYHFEHLDGTGAQAADDAKQARHILVITDRQSQRKDLGNIRFAMQHATAKVAGQRDSITAFMAQRDLQANAVTLASWDYKKLNATNAQDNTTLDQGDIPTLEIFEGSGAYRYTDPAQAERAAALALAALELGVKRFEGQGSARYLSAGAKFRLIDHPLYGANTTALDNPGALLASHARDDNSFTITAVEHHATNNLGEGLVGQAAKLLAITGLERGTYKNHFHAVPAAAAIVPRFIRKPTAPGTQTALVVGVSGQPITTDRDHRVKIQFHWQRGQQPNAGGTDVPNNLASRAPGNETSGTWVRVAEPSAGANWGSSFIPRVGHEVMVGFIEADIDRPVILGGLYNGPDRPPFSAGADSATNHPGVISGIHSPSTDNSGYNQWVVDDASGQLRMRLQSSSTTAEVTLGHLIQQSPASAQRGAWRGSGFEANTQAWATVRAAKGLLISTTARQGSYGSAQGSQMDSQEATAQLKAAKDLGQRLSQAAGQGQAQTLNSHDADQAVDKFTKAIDTAADGKHAGPVNGQEAKITQGSRALTDPTPAYAKAQILLDTPSTALYTSEAEVVSYAGLDSSTTSQSDIHQTAAHTYAQVSGQTSSLFSHEGGMKVYAANGAVSLQAHTDELQIWADKDVTLISVNDSIAVNAKTKIELIAGQSSMVLEGGDITLTMPGNFTVKGSQHAFLGGGSASFARTSLPTMPVNVSQAPVIISGSAGFSVSQAMPKALEPPVATPEPSRPPTLIPSKSDKRDWIEIQLLDSQNKPVPEAPFAITLPDGTRVTGKLDQQGWARVDGVKPGECQVEFPEHNFERNSHN
jgi:type VI secretion system secreted protein VgrG